MTDDFTRSNEICTICFRGLVYNPEGYKQIQGKALYFFVASLGIEPRSKEPESFILSIKLRDHFFCIAKLEKK